MEIQRPQRKSKFNNWQSEILLERQFTPTRFDKIGELSKAWYKNRNLPILQFMYHGNELEPLKCVITGNPGFVDFPCLVSENDKQRFDIDFNHIRQEENKEKVGVAGKSKDKFKVDPSSIFRAKRLDSSPIDLLEFVTIMPVCKQFHSYITQDSAIGDITLQNYKKEHWTWVLQSKENYNDFFNRYRIDVSQLPYEWMIDHLSSIDHDPIRDRININK